ncbi:MAG: type IV pilus modification PilV family protein [Microbacteriaceae bacterium]
MTYRRHRVHTVWARESGFTLIEVLFAVVLLGIVTTAAIGFSIQATESSGAQQRRAVAIGVATQAMESVSANISATDSATGVSYLLTGRQQSAAIDAWNTFGTTPGVANTYPGWDPIATNASVPRIPIESSVTRDGTTFDVATLMGWCFKQTAASDCTTIPAVAQAPSSPPAGWAGRLMRVIVTVQWSSGASCELTPCSYETITFLDATADLEWNNG